MIDIAELIAGWIYSIRVTTPEQWLLRLAVLLSGVGAGVLALAWVPEYLQPAWSGVLVLTLLFAVIRPDSVAPLLGIAVVSLAWMMGGAGTPWWAQLVVVALLAVFHLTSAYAAAAPSYAAISRKAAGRLSLAVLGFTVATTAVAALVLGLTLVPADLIPRGIWWVVAGLVAVCAVAVAVAVSLASPRNARPR